MPSPLFATRGFLPAALTHLELGPSCAAARSAGASDGALSLHHNWRTGSVPEVEPEILRVRDILMEIDLTRKTSDVVAILLRLLPPTTTHKTPDLPKAQGVAG